ncbi:hypothetical protein FHS42_001114 [Streptomyces zagrosensis]|uniref:Uncharacterized protein n=2 Tax=Streptomyces zagrosensis TaxID=1042984 RepID=A0A7W9Q5M6_9ACTN|nr:hypothetical protein [Streptomyces zagrosensis]
MFSSVAAGMSALQRPKGVCMTIYCQHANRGKTQILAVYRRADDAVSSTVTSLGSAGLAAPIVEALNRISALATVPLGLWDERGRRVAHYPTEHLAALTDRAARAGLLSGSHSLWYEWVCWDLHQALADLDKAVAAAPAPIRIAIEAELEMEERELRDALAEYSEAVPVPEENQRSWDSGFPFVPYSGGMHLLTREARKELDRLEEGITREKREAAVSDLRLLVTAFDQWSAAQADDGMFSLEFPEIFAEPYDADHHFLTVSAPDPGGEGMDAWHVDVCRWVPDDPQEKGEEEYSSATGKHLLRCVLPATPSAEDVAQLLSRVSAEPVVLTEWAQTTVGSPLKGTSLIVTSCLADES